jgi:uncharacterized protein YggT (Ycf19 family)
MIDVFGFTLSGAEFGIIILLIALTALVLFGRALIRAGHAQVRRAEQLGGGNNANAGGGTPPPDTKDSSAKSEAADFSKNPPWRERNAFVLAIAITVVTIAGLLALDGWLGAAFNPYQDYVVDEPVMGIASTVFGSVLLYCVLRYAATPAQRWAPLIGGVAIAGAFIWSLLVVFVGNNVVQARWGQVRQGFANVLDPNHSVVRNHHWNIGDTMLSLIIVTLVLGVGVVAYETFKKEKK